MTDFKPGDRAMRGSFEVTILATDRHQAWIRFQDGSNSVVMTAVLEPITEHPIPSEPNTAWVDKDGDVVVVSDLRVLVSRNGTPRMRAAERFAPFTRLVPEGSEREAAIREVVEWLNLQGDTAYSAWVADHFLSGADQ